MQRLTTELIYEWISRRGERYRAVSKGHTTAGYRDSIVVEFAETDALGGVAWIEKKKWATGHPGSGTYGVTEETRFWTLLLDGLECAISERDQAIVERDAALATVKNLYETSNA